MKKAELNKWGMIIGNTEEQVVLYNLPLSKLEPQQLQSESVDPWHPP
jgi:hypothetical protein